MEAVEYLARVQLNVGGEDRQIEAKLLRHLVAWEPATQSLWNIGESGGKGKGRRAESLDG